MAEQAIEKELLARVGASGELADTGALAEEFKVDHQKVVGVMKSLISAEMVVEQVRFVFSSSFVVRRRRPSRRRRSFTETKKTQTSSQSNKKNRKSPTAASPSPTRAAPA
jgi:hypothetical protein